jgi:hypothetical protein
MALPGLERRCRAAFLTRVRIGTLGGAVIVKA